MNTPRRIIDANANRAREAMRVLEEAARFLVQDPELSQQLKTLRHDFTHALAPLDSLILDRDTPGDVGTSLTTDHEHARKDTRDVILAAGSRLAEALRAIEEYAKVDAPDDPHLQTLARTCERLRYQSYDLTQRLALALGSGQRRQWRLCLLLSRSLCTHHDWTAVLEKAVAAGVDCVQVREKEMDAGPLLAHVTKVIERVGQRAAVIVNDRPDIALLAGADGVHLGQADLRPDQARRVVGSRLVIGVSTATLEQAKAAKARGADYCGVGPMFPTTTKHKPDLAGPAYLRDYLAWAGLPHLAIGGVNADNIGELIDAGVQGIAVSSAVCSAKDPGGVARHLSAALAAANPQPS